MGFCFRCAAYLLQCYDLQPFHQKCCSSYGQKLSEFFETRWKTIEKKLTVKTDETTIQFPTYKKKKTLALYDLGSSFGGGL